MKKLSAILVITFLSINTFAQSPNWAWAKNIGGIEDDFGQSVTTDALGNILVTGYFKSTTITFGTTTLINSGGDDIFIVKYSPAGNVIWAKSASGNSDDKSLSVSTDAVGNVIITGSSSSSNMTFGTITITSAGNEYIFISKYDASGNILWAKSVGGAYYDGSLSVSADTTGNIIVTGYFASSHISFGAFTLTNAGNGDVFVVKYSAAGNVLWAKSLGSTDGDQACAVSTDLAGNVFVTGWFYGPSISSGTNTIINAGEDDMFIVKYDPYGNVIWLKSIGGINTDQGYSISVDEGGNVFVTGLFFSPSLFLGPTTLSNADGSGNTCDIFIVKYSPSGDIIWAKSAGGNDTDGGASVSVDRVGNAFVTGNFNGTSAIFGTTTPLNEGYHDVFIAKYDTSGNLLWVKASGGISSDYGYGISIDPVGNVVMTGVFASPYISFEAIHLTNADSVNIAWVTFDIIVAKLGNTPMNINENKITEVKMNIYPNPFSTQTTIRFSEMQKNTIVRIVDIMGNEIKTIDFTGIELTIEKEEMSKGIYFVQAIDKNKKIPNGKIIVQ